MASARQVLRRDCGQTDRYRRVQRGASRVGLQAANPDDVAVGVEVGVQNQVLTRDLLARDLSTPARVRVGNAASFRSLRWPPLSQSRS